MYYVAEVDREICSAKACSLCTTFCPESNCINYSEADKSAYVSVDRCKACEICVYICDDIPSCFNPGRKLCEDLQ